jgi:4-hydroxybutyrate CoA-transferase
MTQQLDSAREAIARIRPGDKVIVAGCSGVPSALLQALVEDSGRLAGLTLYSGMLCGASSYAFMAPPHDQRLRYITWHMPHAFVKGLGGVRAEFLPVSWGRLDRLLEALQPDVALIAVSPAQGGEHSLGVSTGYHHSAVRHARTVIAEVNDRMPWSCGPSTVRAADIDIAVPVSHALSAFDAAAPDDPVAVKVGEQVAALIPDGAVLQVGVGAIPSATLGALRRLGRRISLYSLVTDEAFDLAQAGGLRPLQPGGPSIVAVETLGSQRAWDFIDRNEQVHMVPATQMQNPALLSRLQKLHSVNSCLEIDLTGQCNSEWLGGRQVSGIGGSVDFIEGSWLSPGGMSIIALPSTTRDGRSRIVPALAEGTPVTVPRHALHTVVTEFGVARLFDRSERDRRDALVAIAHPDHREALRRAAVSRMAAPAPGR